MKGLSFKSLVASLAVGVATCAISAPLHAQTAPAPDATSLPDASQDIIVTAQKRSERLIDAPQSVTALSAADFAKLNATQFVDFANTVPGLQFTTLGAGYTQVSLRGVTSGSDTSPTVGIYVDEVPYGSSSAFNQSVARALDAALFDLDRVEVLRGPQGTLYGASSMGGLLKYVTTAPRLDAVEGSVQAGVSSTRYGGTSYNGAAVVNLPIVTDKIAVRASGFYARDGGFNDNLGRQQKNVDRSEVYGGRVDVLMQPTDDLSVRITGFAQDIRRDGARYAAYTLGGDPIFGAFDQNHPLQEPFNSDFRLASATINYDFGFADLTSISSYQYSRTDLFTDISALYVPILPAFGIDAGGAGTRSYNKTRKFTQEIRLASKQDQPLQWLLGGFYTHEKSRLFQAIDTFDPDLVKIPFNLGQVAIPSTYKEYAFFGDITYHLTDKFNVTGGLRYAHNDQRFEQIGSGLLIGSAPAAKSSEGVVTYLANAQYKFSNNATAYARFATGYRPGGPNFVIRDAVSGNLLAPLSFNSDSLESYEIGFKAQTRDRSFAIDLSAFYVAWDDIQIITAVQGLSANLNAGTAKVRGAELNLTARPSDDLTFTGAFAYNDGEIGEDNPAIGAVKGERLPNVPRFTAALNADYVATASALRPFVGATLRFVSDRTVSFNQSVGLPQYQLPDYTSVDLRAGLSIGTVDAQLFVRNIFDKRGQLAANTSQAAAGAAVLTTLLQPRTLGLSASMKF
jgi:iron complex outermembrane recepter protein